MGEIAAPVLDLEVELAAVTVLAAEVELELKPVLLGSADETVGRVPAGLEELPVELENAEDKIEEDKAVRYGVDVTRSVVFQFLT